MKLGRRSLLAAAVVPIVGMAGCSEDETPPPAEAGGNGGGGNGNGNEDEQEDTDEEPIADDLEGRLGHIADEIAWFDNDYYGVMREYREIGNRLESTVAELQDVDELTQSDIDRIRADIDPLEEYIEAEMVEYFPSAANIPPNARRYLSDLERYAPIGDTSVIEEELQDLRGYLNRVTSEPYIESNFSRHPISNRLVEYLEGESAEDHPLFEVWYNETGNIRRDASFLTFAHQRGEDVDINPYGDPFEWGQNVDAHTVVPGVFDLFEVPEGREASLYLIVNEWGGERAYARDLHSQPVYIQRYEDAAAAEAAHEGLLEESVNFDEDRTTQFGDESYPHINYVHHDDIWYALFRQVGPYLLVAAPGEQPFERRDDDWRDPLEDSWLRIDSEEEDDEE